MLVSGAPTPLWIGSGCYLPIYLLSVAPKLQDYSVEDVVSALETQLNLGQYADRFRTEVPLVIVYYM